MKKLSFVVSLTTADNDYQLEQASAAKEAARRLGASLQVIYAGNDVVTQSQQLLKIIQSPAVSRPHAILFEPVGKTALPQVARAALAAGIGWVILNQTAEYLPELRHGSPVPIFAISSDHLEIGRIQGRQFAALLPNGGTALYIQGPPDNPAARQRTEGMESTKPANIRIIPLKGLWTEASANRSVASWLGLSASRDARVNLIGAQDDSMAIGARNAFKEKTSGEARDQWLSLPFTGCDGLPNSGQAAVRMGTLAATVIVPPNTTLALETVVQAIESGQQPPELGLTVPDSFPSLDTLLSRRIG